MFNPSTLACQLVAIVSVLCCATRAQGQVRVAIDEIKAAFENHGITRDTFPRGAIDPADFDPDEHDPLYLNQIWESVLPDVTRILDMRLGVSEKPTLLFQVISAASSIDPDGNEHTSKRCRVVFVVGGDNVRQVLKDAMSLPDECFRKAVQTTRTLVFQTGEMRHTSLRDIGVDISTFANSDAMVRQNQFQPQAPIYLADKVQLVTNWKRMRRRSGYDEYWRIFLQVKKEGNDQFNVSARAQFGRNLPEAPLSQLTYRGSDEDPPPELQQFVGGTEATKLEENWVTEDGMGGDFLNAAQVSPIGAQLENLLIRFSASLKR